MLAAALSWLASSASTAASAVVRVALTKPPDSVSSWWGLVSPGAALGVLLGSLQRGYLRLGAAVDQQIALITKAADDKVVLVERQLQSEREARLSSERDAAQRIGEAWTKAERQVATAESLAEKWGQAAERRADEADRRAEESRRMLEQQVIPALTLASQALSLGRVQQETGPPSAPGGAQ